jgi:hypothetical protein
MSPLKVKIIDEYEKYVHQLHKGYRPDYNYILDMISFTEMGSKTKNPEIIQNHFLVL